MDSRGWIPIALIASFNRVKQLTQDEQLVRDVLSLSSLIEVRNDHVRMSNGQWHQFVLPNAPESTVESEAYTGAYSQSNELSADDSHVVEEGETEVEEEEEDEVEFVMDRAADPVWTLDHGQSGYAAT